MGMSSSQARLLTLTARQHSIEYKAQRLQAEKLRLANESDRVYDAYLDALDAKKIQYKAISADGSTTFKDATLNAMENGIIGNWAGETSNEVLFVQNAENGKMYVTPAVAEKYGLTSTANETRDLDTFVEETTGKTKSTRDIISQHEVVDTTKITSFTAIGNNETKQPVNNVSHTYNPVANIEGGIDYSALAGYASFDPTSSASTAGATEITSSTTSLTAGGTYTVSDADGLMKLMELADSTNTAGTTIILTDDIDLSGKSWTGINNFAGTFDGNGHKITNLTGTQGLFASTSNATVKNVGLENVNINGNAAYIGGLIGNATTTNITNCYTTGTINNSYSGSISSFASGSYSCGTGGLVGYTYTPGGQTAIFDNIYSSVDVTSSSDCVGGLIGSGKVGFSNGKFDIKNAYAIGNVSGKNGVGGFIGAMYNDEDNSSDITDIRNCYSGGNVTGGNEVGGFFGAYLYWGDRGDYCEIEGCNSTGKVNASGSEKGAFAGHLYVKMASASEDTLDQYLIKFIDCGYADNTGVANAYGTITDEDGKTTATVGSVTKTIDEFVQSSGAGAGLTSFKLAGSIPSINADGSGDYMQNIIAALAKAGAYDPCDPETTAADKTAMETKIKNFLNSFSNNDTDNAKLWYLNNAINNYLKGTGSNNLGTALAQDIQNGTKTATAGFQTGNALDGSVKRANDTSATVLNGTHDVQKGEVTIASTKNIAEQLYYALKVENKIIDQVTVTNWINNNYNTSNADDKVYLANINNSLAQGTDLDALYNAITTNTKYTDATLYNKEDWNVNFAADTTVNFSYGTKMENYVSGQEEYWDTTDPDIANAIAMYALAQRGVEVVTDEQASSKVWISNMVAEGQAVITTFNPSQVAELASKTEDELINMTDAEYEKLMGIENTSVSVKTSMREVADETNLKKAEAQYEADMKRIDRKDAYYDRQLAVCENERNANNLEMETLKNVIKDNVDMNFKLFS